MRGSSAAASIRGPTRDPHGIAGGYCGRTAQRARPRSETPPYDPAVDDASFVFLMTDIVGSTRLWAEHPEAMGLDLAVHDDVSAAPIAEHGGVTISKGGDSFAAAFDRADDAVAAAVSAQKKLAATTWRVTDGIRVRMGVHLGAAQRRGDSWYGPPLNETRG